MPYRFTQTADIYSMPPQMPKPHYAPSRRQLIFAILALLAALLVRVTAYCFARSTSTATGIGTALVGGPFTLTDQTGKVTDEDFRGKYMLIFFGFTYCPDVCPTELQVMSAALDQLGPAADEIQPVFITIDPERDTPEAMKHYVANFHPRMVGLTGTPRRLPRSPRPTGLLQQGGEKFRARGLSDGPLHHLYLMGPDGNFVSISPMVPMWRPLRRP